jgi:antitoxin VapB
MEEAKLFKNGQSQAVRLPRQYRFRGAAVYIRKLGNTVLLMPKYLSPKIR